MMCPVRNAPPKFLLREGHVHPMRVHDGAPILCYNRKAGSPAALGVYGPSVTASQSTYAMTAVALLTRLFATDRFRLERWRPF